MADFKVNTSDLQAFAAGLKRANRKLAADFRADMRKSSETIVQEARGLSSSEKIGATIKAKPRALKSGVRVTFEAGGPGMPEAVLLERGNRGSNPDAETFKHPVFPRKGTGRSEWTWVEQKKRRYLTIPVEQHKEMIVNSLRESVDRNWHEAGPRGV